MWDVINCAVDASGPRGVSAASGGLSVVQLGKRFGGVEVFRDLSFDLPPGNVMGVVGPNGAGKTTLINVLCGMLAPSAGQILLNGQELVRHPFHFVARKGVVRSFQHTNIFGSETACENLLRAARFSGHRTVQARRVLELVDGFGLAHIMRERSDSLPYGSQKMLGLLMAYLARPKVLLLDEPAAGLERSERAWIDRFVAMAKDELGCSVLLVEHDMELIKRLCPVCMVLDGGKLIASGPTTQVLARKDVIAAYIGAEEP